MRELAEILSGSDCDPDALVIVAFGDRRHLVRYAEVTRIRFGGSLDYRTGGAWLPALVLDTLDEL